MNSAPLSAGKKWNQDKKKEEVRYLVKYTGIGYTQQNRTKAPPPPPSVHTHTQTHTNTRTLPHLALTNAQKQLSTQIQAAHTLQNPGDAHISTEINTIFRHLPGFY